MQGCQETAMSSFITNFLCWVQIPIYCLKIHDHRIFTQMIINKYLRFTNGGGESNQRRKDVSPNRQAEDNVVSVMWFEDTVIAQVSRRWHTRNFRFFATSWKDLSCQCQPGDETLCQSILFSEIWVQQWRSHIDLLALGELGLHTGIRIPRARSLFLWHSIFWTWPLSSNVHGHLPGSL